jgi:pyruvate dehydrogenase E1 component
MQHDIDAIETREWLDALRSVVRYAGKDRAAELLKSLSETASTHGIEQQSAIQTAYINTIPVEKELPYPGDQAVERSIRSIIRWNAMAMVAKANDNDEGLGGHIASFASSATLYDVGFNHFFRGNDGDVPGDLIYFQGHISPGIYSRSFLEGRFDEATLDNFRREVDGKGLSSYPHPWLMPDYWQFPTVSMGLGPIKSIYQARYMRYLEARNHIPKTDRKVWAFLGDGECDEPESLGALTLASRENLDNLIFVINCNLQRLDGPVRGNGKIVQELEGVFRGAGWNVIKVLWGSNWDELLKKDTSGLLRKRMEEVVDGEMQNFKANGGAYTREHFFGKYPELLELVKDLSDDDILHLARGGHDPKKVYNAYHQAVNANNGKPTVIFAQTVKGYGMGASGQAINKTHSVKQLSDADLVSFRNQFGLPLSDEALKRLDYYRPAADSAEMKYLNERRKQLNGFLPSRKADFPALEVPELDAFAAQLKSTGEREISTTMSFVRILSTLVKDKKIGKRIVPIVPDEARTFGMEGMFKSVGIYSPLGQKYTPHDASQMMSYHESESGQILEEGINEAGAMSSWIAAATSYSNHESATIPFYIYYSMFGFQRIGDLAWAAGDSQARGFLLGATAGRTTLNGEGLQHQDGHSHVLANTIPNCRTYDPSYAFELAVIIQDGIKRMYHDKENVFYYISLMNENYQHPEMPQGAEEGIIKGMYLLEQGATGKTKNRVQLLGAGTILREVRLAAEILRNDFDVESDIWSVTSVNELTRDGQRATRWNMLNPAETKRKPYITQILEGREGPVVISTDYLKTYAEQLRAYIPTDYTVLGCEGFGRSDTRTKLRHFFEVNRYFVVIAALTSLANQGKIKTDVVTKAIKKFGIDPNKADPLSV